MVYVGGTMYIYNSDRRLGEGVEGKRTKIEDVMEINLLHM
jgi:hypothetical protein